MPAKPNGLVAKFRNHPVIAGIITLGLVGTGLVGINAGISASDQMVVTHAELADHNATIHPAGELLIQEVELKNECRWLDDKIDRLDDLIWELQQQEADPGRIHDKEKALAKYRDQYVAQGCGRVKY